MERASCEMARFHPFHSDACVALPRSLYLTILRHRPQYTHGAHRSDAEELVAQFPITEVDGTVALCDGGGGAMGHPIEYIQVRAEERKGRKASVARKRVGGVYDVGA